MTSAFSVLRTHDLHSYFRGAVSMCVAPKLGLVIIAGRFRFLGNQSYLSVRCLRDGAILREVPIDEGFGSVCLGPDGESVLVACTARHFLSQIRIGDCSPVRKIGRGVLFAPHFVDCNAAVIVVSEECSDRINVINAQTAVVMWHFERSGGEGPLRGLRLLPFGRGMVATRARTLSVFNLRGDLLRSMNCGSVSPADVALFNDHVLMTSNGFHVFELVGSRPHKVFDGSISGERACLSTLAVASPSEVVVLDRFNKCYHVLRDLTLVVQWMCVAMW